MDRGQRDGQRTEGERGEGREEQVQVFTKGVNPNGAPFPPHAPSLPVCTPSSRYRERFLALLALGDVLSSAHTLSLIIILSSSMSARRHSRDTSLQYGVWKSETTIKLDRWSSDSIVTMNSISLPS